VAHKVILFWQ